MFTCELFPPLFSSTYSPSGSCVNMIPRQIIPSQWNGEMYGRTDRYSQESEGRAIKDPFLVNGGQGPVLSPSTSKGTFINNALK